MIPSRYHPYTFTLVVQPVCFTHLVYFPGWTVLFTVQSVDLSRYSIPFQSGFSADVVDGIYHHYWDWKKYIFLVTERSHFQNIVIRFDLCKWVCSVLPRQYTCGTNNYPDWLFIKVMYIVSINLQFWISIADPMSLSVTPLIQLLSCGMN
jgi:hypothetical protein